MGNTEKKSIFPFVGGFLSAYFKPEESNQKEGIEVFESEDEFIVKVMKKEEGVKLSFVFNIEEIGWVPGSFRVLNDGIEYLEFNGERNDVEIILTGRGVFYLSEELLKGQNAFWNITSN